MIVSVTLTIKQLWQPARLTAVGRVLAIKKLSLYLLEENIPHLKHKA